MAIGDPVIERCGQLQRRPQPCAGSIDAGCLHLVDQPVAPRFEIARREHPNRFAGECSRQMFLYAGRIAQMPTTAREISFVSGQCIGHRHRLVAVVGIGLTPGKGLRRVASLVKREHVGCIGILKVVSDCEAFRPVTPVPV